MNATARRNALARLHAHAEEEPLLVVATGPFVGEGFDCLGFPDPRRSASIG
jgi:hypothetical protein